MTQGALFSGLKLHFLILYMVLAFVIFVVQPFSELKLRVNCHHFFVFLFQSLCPFPAEVIRQELQKFPGAKGSLLDFYF